MAASPDPHAAALAAAARGIIAADPGTFAQAIHPALATVFGHEAVAVHIGHCAEAVRDEWTSSRAREALDRAGRTHVPACGETNIDGLAHTAFDGEEQGGPVCLAVLSRAAPDAPTAALLQQLAELVSARFAQSRRLAHPSRLAVSRAIVAERRRVNEELLGRQSAALEAILAALRAEGDPATRAAAAERAASDALLALRDGVTRDLGAASAPAATVFAGCQAALVPAAERAGLRPEFALDGPGETPMVEPVVQAATFITRAAVENAARHAGASRIRVHWRAESADLLLSVADDGAGFDPARGADGAGLRDMRARADALGGDLEIESSAGWGTRIRVRLPLQPAVMTGASSHAQELVARLGDRELEILALVAAGAPNREIAEALHLSQHTVKAHLTNVMDKLEVRSRAGLGRIYAEARLDAA